MTLVISDRGHPGQKVNTVCRITMNNGSPLTRWRLRVENETNLAVRSVTYPSVRTPLSLGGNAKDDFVIWPVSNEAERLPAPGENVRPGQGFDTHL